MNYKYTVTTGVVKQKLVDIKKVFIGVVATAGIIGVTAVPTFAVSNGYCGSSANGCESAAAAGAQCGTGAGSGAFGAFGKDNNFAGGADGRQTGLNNSAVCGNRQGNL